MRIRTPRASNIVACSGLVLSTALILTVSGCSVRPAPQDPLFDSLEGKGPIVMGASDKGAPCSKFFQENWQRSQAIKGLVERHGAPQAISVEREFLQPHRLKLFYPSEGQVYLLDLLEGDWSFSGAEPIKPDELIQQAQKRS